MPDFNYGNPVADQGSNLAFVRGKYEHVFSKMQEVKRPKFLWRDTLPDDAYDDSIDPFAEAVSYVARDVRGQGGFIGPTGENIKTVGFTYFKRSFKLHTSGVKFGVSHEDINRYKQNLQSVTGRNDIFSEYGNAAGVGMNSHIESVVFFGDAASGYDGLVDYPDIPVSLAADSISNPGNTEWSNKTPDEVLADLTDAIGAVYINTGQTFIPDTIELPPVQYATIIALKSGNVSTPNTVWKFFLENNIATANGKELIFRANRYLTGTGVGGTDRMRIITNEEDIMIMPLPQWPGAMLEPQQTGFLTEVYMRYVFGQPIILHPESQQYVDGI